MPIVPVILCGGAGTRLWPASRADAPKPFLPLVGGGSTFALTLERVADRAQFAPPVVIASVAHRLLVREALAAASVTDATVLLEPEGRDTAVAVAVAAVAVGPGQTVLILPADHAIRDVGAFGKTVARGTEAAKSGAIVVFGIRPTYPSVDFGYIRPGVAFAAARMVDAFIEKPDATRAVELIAEGCFWNAGIFLFSTATALREFGRHAPDVLAAAEAAVGGAKVESGAKTLAAAALAAAPKRSFDYAVMEKTTEAAVVAAEFSWSDLGTWAAVWEAAEHDANGNTVAGDVVLVDTRGSYVASDRDRVGVVGLENVVVVVGNGSVLVTTRDRSAAVKNLVMAIDSAPEKLVGDFVRHYRPWGHYQSLDVSPGHQVKRIVVDPGQRLSLQKHAHRAEHWTVVSGEADITVGMALDALETTKVRPGGHVHIPQGAIHRMANHGETQMTLIEVQVGDYLGEDDIVRFEDDYGREGP